MTTTDHELLKESLIQVLHQLDELKARLPREPNPALMTEAVEIMRQMQSLTQERHETWTQRLEQREQLLEKTRRQLVHDLRQAEEELKNTRGELQRLQRDMKTSRYRLEEKLRAISWKWIGAIVASSLTTALIVSLGMYLHQPHPTPYQKDAQEWGEIWMPNFERLSREQRRRIYDRMLDPETTPPLIWSETRPANASSTSETPSSTTSGDSK